MRLVLQCCGDVKPVLVDDTYDIEFLIPVNGTSMQYLLNCITVAALNVIVHVDC